MPITYKNSNFISLPSYYSPTDDGAVIVYTDKSFTVTNSLTMSVAFYVNNAPALIMQGMPNTNYIFNTMSISYYLTVTDLEQGYVLSKMNSATYPATLVSFISISTPVKVVFGPGESSLTYALDGTLNFNRVPSQ